MKKWTAPAAAILLSLGLFAAPAAADDGATGDVPGVTDPGAEALHQAIAAFRGARAAEAECRDAAASDACRSARSEARALFQSVRADAAAAHRLFSEQVRAWKAAKTPEQQAALAAKLKDQAEHMRSVIEAHKDDIHAMRSDLEARLAKLDPKLRDSVRKDALAIEQAAREKNVDELAAKLQEAAAKYGLTSDGTAPALTGAAGKPGTTSTGPHPLPTLPPGFKLPSDLRLPSGMLPSIGQAGDIARPTPTPTH